MGSVYFTIMISPVTVLIITPRNSMNNDLVAQLRLDKHEVVTGYYDERISWHEKGFAALVILLDSLEFPIDTERFLKGFTPTCPVPIFVYTSNPNTTAAVHDLTKLGVSRVLLKDWLSPAEFRHIIRGHLG